MKKTPPKPTDSELAILRVLWRLGPATVRAVHDELNRAEETGYTTVLKLLQIMTEKGLVKRDESDRSHIYRTAFPRVGGAAPVGRSFARTGLWRLGAKTCDAGALRQKAFARRTRGNPQAAR